jgi:putative nucleotidyltransferase with HDIG domain
LERDGTPKAELALRVGCFCLGSGLAGATAYYLGFGAGHALAIGAVTAVLAGVAAELPWGGFFLPSDALVLSICLVAARFEAAAVGLGAALASSMLISRRRRMTAITGLRNVTAALATVAVWRSLVGPDILGSYGYSLVGSEVFAKWIFSARAIPALAAAALAFFAVASVVELSLRPQRGFGLREFVALNFSKHMYHVIFTLVVGAIVAVAYLDIGALAFVLFGFPLVLTRDALKRHLDLRRSRVEALRALSSSVDARDSYTYDHSSRVSRLSAMLAREMGFPEATVEMIESGALLHDIGKISLDLDILSKPGPLTSEERKAVRRHPLESAQVVASVELFHGAVDIVRHHHERPDGQGYPDGLKADQISMGARILNVADAFDAMTSDRPYRKRRSVSDALGELRKGSGSEFDPVVVEYLMRLLRNRTRDIASLGLH